jgi:hypothetical protein
MWQIYKTATQKTTISNYQILLLPSCHNFFFFLQRILTTCTLVLLEVRFQTWQNIITNYKLRRACNTACCKWLSHINLEELRTPGQNWRCSIRDGHQPSGNTAHMRTLGTVDQTLRWDWGRHSMIVLDRYSHLSSIQMCNTWMCATVLHTIYRRLKFVTTYKTGGDIFFLQTDDTSGFMSINTQY